MINLLIILSFRILTSQFSLNDNFVDLSAYKWKNRIILVFPDLPDESTGKQQIETLLVNKKELEDRNLVIFKILNDDTATSLISGESFKFKNDFYKQFKVERGFFRILLIGKDGTVKLNSDNRVEPRQIFTLIDSMPMRQSEMSKNP
ncbi:MAG: DUF4174 domain-containing protein [Cyclobacteriaceae bacterium]|nr:DUF4174 domain-containing protein [Cyclobacteriaceae bacterium]